MDNLKWFRDSYIKEHNNKMRQQKKGFSNIRIDLESLGFHWNYNKRSEMDLDEILLNFQVGDFLLNEDNCTFNIEDFIKCLNDNGLISEDWEYTNLLSIARKIL